jgi:NAD+ synthase (glutamine-hydrolysing)
MLGIVPKSYLPNYREFYEVRQCTSGAGIRGAEIEVAGRRVPFGVDLLFQSQGSVPFTAHVEICEDVGVPQPPSTAAALAGAEVLLNLSASNITVGKADIQVQGLAKRLQATNIEKIVIGVSGGLDPTQVHPS